MHHSSPRLFDVHINLQNYHRNTCFHFQCYLDSFFQMLLLRPEYHQQMIHLIIHSMANHYLFSKSFTLLLLTLLLFSLKRLLLFKVLPYILRLNFIYHYVFRIPLILNQSFFIFSFFYDASFYFCFKLHFD